MGQSVENRLQERCLWRSQKVQGVRELAQYVDQKEFSRLQHLGMMICSGRLRRKMVQTLKDENDQLRYQMAMLMKKMEERSNKSEWSEVTVESPKKQKEKKLMEWRLCGTHRMVRRYLLAHHL